LGSRNQNLALLNIMNIDDGVSAALEEERRNNPPIELSKSLFRCFWFFGKMPAEGRVSLKDNIKSLL
jgi:hypothetical protein